MDLANKGSVWEGSLEQTGNVRTHNVTLRRVRITIAAMVKHISVRLTSLTHSVRMRPNFQGLPCFEFDGLRDEELLMLFLLN